MKKIFFISFLIFITFFLVILTTIGYETNKFNNIISEKIKTNNSDVKVDIKKIKFKFDIKDLHLFIETNNPKLFYKNIEVPIVNIKIYLNLVSLIKSQVKIEHLTIQTKKMNFSKLKSIVLETKPSNINSLIINQIKTGTLKTKLELYFDDNFKVENYIARGNIEKMNFKIDKYEFSNTNFDFFSDSSDVVIKNIKSNLDGVSFYNGDLQLNYDNEINLKTSFETVIDVNNKKHLNYFKILKKNDLSDVNINVKGKLNHNVEIFFDKTMKVHHYDYSTKGKLDEFVFKDDNKNVQSILNQQVEVLNFTNSDISFALNSKNNNYFNSSGNYSLNNFPLSEYKVSSNFKNKFYNVDLDLKYPGDLNLEFINYKKEKEKIARLSLKFSKNDNEINLKKINYAENKNEILIENLKLNNNSLVSFKNIKVRTYKKNDLQNYFDVNYGKTLKVSGNRYDASNLNKIINQKSKGNILKNLNKNIDINLKQITTPLSEKLKNFRLIGKIEEGKFVKLSAKGDFEDNRFLDIKLNKDKTSSKKYLEVYSDIPQPLLSEYAFFKGLTGGKLLLTSEIDEKQTNSKLIIENFKVKNAPGVVKLLSLADFGGLADLAEGEGLSFEKLEIVMTDNKEVLKLEELFAVGPSISVLMEGYKDNNGMTSLRGTLVPAKNLNKLIAKIPVIGNIVIPKEVGEGLFGVSFKMKGPPGKIKTTINPIKTLTPRFITRALEKSKKPK